MVGSELFSGRGRLLSEASRFTVKQSARTIGMAGGSGKELIETVVMDNRAAEIV